MDAAQPSPGAEQGPSSNCPQPRPQAAGSGLCNPTRGSQPACLGMLAVTEATPDSLRLSWAVARGPFDSFVVQYQDTENQTQALLVDGDQDKVLISGLEPKTSYKFFLYGLREGTRHGPVSVEGTTGRASCQLTSVIRPKTTPSLPIELIAWFLSPNPFM